ncbi:hypothetical protein [Ekhidna sp.]|uniref:hypothetical protein n=1 Tax=Ekhidna sp. TaxID=2608089 RepID=UPI003296AF78
MKKTLIILAVIVLSSCVSQKKYDALEAELVKYKVDDTFQSKEVADVAYSKTNDITELKKELNNLKIQNKELTLKVKDLEEQLEDCNQ